MTYPALFTVQVDGRGPASCWRAESQEYADCMLSAGLAGGIPPDTIFARLERHGEDPLTIFMRPDEALALARCIIGAVWSDVMFQRHPEDVPAVEVPPAT